MNPQTTKGYHDRHHQTHHRQVCFCSRSVVSRWNGDKDSDRGGVDRSKWMSISYVCSSLLFVGEGRREGGWWATAWGVGQKKKSEAVWGRLGKKNVRSERKADLKNGFIHAKTLEWHFCKYTRSGSNKIRDRPAPGIGAICVTRNRPVTSTGRGGSGRVGSDRGKIVIPNLWYPICWVTDISHEWELWADN